MSEESIGYLSRYIKVSEQLKEKIERHARKYGISPEICAWYTDWEDFCSDWCDGCGYTRTQARKLLLHSGSGEFMILPDGCGIIRFSL